MNNEKELYNCFGYMMPLSALMKKYILIENKIYYYGMFHKLCQVNNNFWYVTYDNTLYRLDNITGEIEAVCILEAMTPWAYSKILQWGDSLIILPLRGSTITIYDMRTGEIMKCPIGEVGGCMDAHVYKEKIYFVNIVSNEIFCYNIKENECRKIGFDKVWKSKKLINWSISSCIIGSKFYFVLFATNLLCEYDLATEQVVWRTLPCDLDVYAAVASYDQGIFIMGYKRKHALYWKVSQEEALCFECGNCSWKEWKIETVYMGNKVNKMVCKETIDVPTHLCEWIPYVCDNRIMVYDNVEGVYIFDVFQRKVYQKKIFLDVPRYDFCRFVDVVNNKLCLLPVYEDNTIYFSDGKRIVVNDREMWGRKGLETIAVNSIVKEGGMWNLKRYIDMLETEVDSSQR